MTPPPYQEALNYWRPDQPGLEVQPLAGGLIHQTLKVTPPDGPSVILQQINRTVFPDPEQIIRNHQQVAAYTGKQAIPFEIPAPLPFRESVFVFTDQAQQSWRLISYIPGGKSLSEPETSAQVEATARGFGLFARHLRGMNPAVIQPAIPGFHDLAWRYRQLGQALTADPAQRAGRCREEIKALLNRVSYRNLYDNMAGSGQFPRRLLHHDAKIANVLFDRTDGRLIGLVDLDTVMPGFFFSDLGDLIRSQAGSIPEDGTVSGEVTIRDEWYRLLTKTYAEAMGDMLNEAELEHLHYAGIFLVYMQALRFLADYINGDVYYCSAYPEQNLDRTRNQLALLIQLEHYLKKQKLLPHA